MNNYANNINSQSHISEVNNEMPLDLEANSQMSNESKNSTIINNIFIINNYQNNNEFLKNSELKSSEHSVNEKTNSYCDEDDNESLENSTSQNLMCRICHCEEISEEYLIAPCYCSGTLRYVHQSCLQQWLKSNGIKSCELCKYDFIMSYETRPFKNWEKLDMNNIERRKILCSVTFHVIALVCVIWSLYVLIDRTAEEGRSKQFDWSFWTKIVIVAIGFTGGVVFMYIQFKMYIQLCNRWRQYNRVIIIQPITDEILKNSKQKLHESNKCLSNKILVSKSKNSEKTAMLNNSDENALLLMNNLVNNNNSNNLQDNNLNLSNQSNRPNPNETVVNFV